MSDPEPEKTANACYEELQPLLADLSRLIAAAPCNRAGLAIMVAAHAFGVVSAAMGEGGQAVDARVIADIIVGVVTRRPQLRLVVSQ